MAEAPVVEVRDLSIRYPGADRPALDGVSLELGRGELVGVVGRNGSGKSTLGLALDGIVPLLVASERTGSVRVGGLEAGVAPVRDLAQVVGIVFDDPELRLVGSTAAEEVAFGLEHLRVPPEDLAARVSGALALVGLAGLEDRSPLSLSGGELGRLAVAAAIAPGPALLVLDEPTASLDPAGAVSVLALLEALRRDPGTTVLVAAQDLEGLASVADRLVVLDAGRIVAEGSAPSIAGSAALLRRHGVRVPAGAEPVHRARAGGPRRAGSIVSIRELRFGYPGGGVALDGVSLEIAEGSVVGLVGANGSGKTTLLRHLNGLLRPGAGSVVVAGREVGRRPVRELARDVGYVFQNPRHQLFRATVGEELAVGPRQLGLPTDEVERRVGEVAGRLGLDGLLDAHPHRLGAAARKLAAIGAVATMRPRVLVLDEPTAGADAPAAEAIERLVRDLAADGTTVLCAGHDLRFLGAVADRIVALRAGRVVADLEPPDLAAAAELLAETEQRSGADGRTTARAGPRRLDPVVKLAWAGAAVAVAVVAYDPRVLAAVGCAAIGAAARGRALGRVVRGLAVLLPIAASAIVLQATAPAVGSGTAAALVPPVATLGPIAIGLEGLTRGLSFAARILALAAIASALVATTDPGSLLAALRRLRVPYLAAFMATLTLRFVPLLGREVGLVLAAQRARGLPARGIGALVPSFVPIFAGAFERAEALAVALEARGFGARDPGAAFRRRRASAGDRVLAIGAVGAGGAGVAAALAWWDRAGTGAIDLPGPVAAAIVGGAAAVFVASIAAGILALERA